jgi:fatty acid desaturase
MTFLCQYRHIFGKEKEGIHSYRIMDIAIMDVLFTFIGALVIAYWFKLNIILVFIVLIILGTIIHYIFCVETTITKMFLYK